MTKARTVVIDHGRERSLRRVPAAVRPLRRSRGGVADSPLKEIEDFGPNPGALRLLAHAPRNLPASAPLVVVLHGCSQDAAGYDAASGWSRLADELGFSVIYPEQRAGNNPAGCFNWFLPADASRGLGESRSICEMIDFVSKTHGADPQRIFVTGLSAGGAMASALLADYPEVFAAGAVIAGLPCGAATSVKEALRVMTRPDQRSAADLGDLVRARSPHEGPWPRVLVIQGDRDDTVAPSNADELVKQWLDVHGANPQDVAETALGAARRRVWSEDGRAVVEEILIPGMGHGAPIDGDSGERAAPFMLDVGLSSTRLVAAFFGFEGAMAAQERPTEAPQVETQAAPDAPAQTATPPLRPGAPRQRQRQPQRPSRSGSWSGSWAERHAWTLRELDRFGVGAAFRNGLKALGLMR